jgi:hypothetical protein
MFALRSAIDGTDDNAARVLPSVMSARSAALDAPQMHDLASVVAIIETTEPPSLNSAADGSCQREDPPLGDSLPSVHCSSLPCRPISSIFPARLSRHRAEHSPDAGETLARKVTTAPSVRARFRPRAARSRRK